VNGGKHSVNICTARHTNIIDGVGILELVKDIIRTDDNRKVSKVTESHVRKKEVTECK
jgi:hypothetical protein